MSNASSSGDSQNTTPGNPTPTTGPAKRISSNQAWHLLFTIIGVLSTIFVLIWSIYYWNPLNMFNKTVENTDIEAIFVSGIEEQSGAGNDKDKEEWRLARAIHRALAYQIYDCFHAGKVTANKTEEDKKERPEKNTAEDAKQKPMSYAVFNQLRMNLTPEGDHRFRVPKDQKENIRVNDEPLSVPLSHYQRASIFLSDAVATARVAAANAVQRASPTVWWFQTIGLILAILGTVFITLKSGIPEEKLQKWNLGLVIGILAIMTSAIGTTLNNYNARNDAFEAVANNRRELAQLRQLHLTLTMAVIAGGEACGSTPELTADQKKNLALWREQFTQIQAGGEPFGRPAPKPGAPPESKEADAGSGR